MMKSLTLTAVILSTIVLAGCTLPGSTNTSDTMMKDDTMMGQTDSNTQTQEQMDTTNNETMIKDDVNMVEQEMEKQDDAMMKDDTMMKNDDAMMDDSTQDAMIQSAGSYETYNAGAVQSALSSGKEVVLFFHASRCPSCRNLEADINANTLPDNTVVFKIDYDNSTDLKKKYGVTTQHTLVRIDSDLSMTEKNIGGTFTDLVKLF